VTSVARRLVRWSIAGIAALGWLVARPAHAIEYEIFVDVEDEDELYDLYATGQLTEGSYVALLELMREGTNLDEADRETLYALPNLTYTEVDRILAYRTEAGRIRDPAALVPAGVLSARKLRSIAAFLTIGDGQKAKAPVNGFVQYQTVYMPPDPRVPPMSLQARVTTLRHLTMGFAGLLTRNRLGDVSWDPNREGLIADELKPRVRLPKAYIQWDTPEYGVIVGSYRAGFGQRLTFDNSNRYTPNGFYLDDTIIRRVKSTSRCKESAGELDAAPCDTDEFGVPDHSFRVGLLGVAAGAKRIKVKQGWLQTYGFFSYQPRDIYQYQIYDKNVCDDPTEDSTENPLCGSPSVYRRPSPALAETSEYSYQTLPNMFDLVLGGGNFAWFYDRRTHVGATGYGAKPRWLVSGADLDFRPYSPYPYGGAFGAVGADASWGYRWADLFVEVSRSFDHEDGRLGGGMAGILRHTATWDVHEIEASVRYYDDDYNNPFARPISATDQSGGVRARDEIGGRIRYSAYLGDRASLRTFFDVWSDTTGDQIQLNTYVRTDVDVNKWFRPGLWFQVRDRNFRSAEAVLGAMADSDPLITGTQLTESYCDLGDTASEVDGNDSIVTDTTDFSDVDPDSIDENGLTLCTGERYSVTPRFRFAPHKRVWLLLQYRHDFVEDGNYPDSIRHDANALFTISARPIDPLRLRMRWRYYSDDIADSARLEESVWGYFDVAYRVARWMTPRIRYDIMFRLDDRDSTRARSPNPEHWVMFEVESRF
jgi:hypothetical protein